MTTLRCGESADLGFDSQSGVVVRRLFSIFSRMDDASAGDLERSSSDDLGEVK